jgi:hypothetical protein
MIINPYSFAAVPSGYTATSAVFDGTNDYLDRTANLTGTADSKVGLFSAWLKMGAGSNNAAFNAILTWSTGGSYITRDTSGRVEFQLSNSSAAPVVKLRSNSSSLVIASGWVHVLASWDTSTAGRRHLYINGSAQTTVVTFTADGVIDYAATVAGIEVGGFSGGQSKFNGLMAEVYFAQEWLDISVEANREKFILAGAPVDLGADGSTPTGTQPILYLSNPYGTFNENLGSGGDFTVVGALADGGSDHP